MKKRKLNMASRVAVGSLLTLWLSLFTSMTTASAPGYSQIAENPSVMAKGAALQNIEASILEFSLNQR